MKYWFFVSFWATTDGKNQIGNCQFSAKSRCPSMKMIRLWEEGILKDGPCDRVTIISFQRTARRIAEPQQPDNK
jgi:hypothetical protein